MITRPIRNSIENIDPKGATWVNKVFSHPERTIRVGHPLVALVLLNMHLNVLVCIARLFLQGDIDANCKTHTLRTIV